MAKKEPKLVNKYATIDQGVTLVHHNLEQVELPDGAIALTDEEHEKLAVGSAKIEDGKVIPV